MKISTLCFLKNDDHILLGMKKRNFGKGRWNGIGGKVERGESITVAAVRELGEEIGISCDENDLQQVALLEFRSENQGLDWDVHVFFLRRWNNEPKESEEISPKWFKENELPFSDMWPDDKYWFPHLLSGESIHGKFQLDNEGKEILHFDIIETQFTGK